MGGSATKGLFAGARGGSRALADYILNQRSQRNALAAEGRQEARTIATETRKQKAGAPLQQAEIEYYNARAKAAGKETEPKMPTESNVLGLALQEALETGDFSKYERAKQAGKEPENPAYSKGQAFDDAVKLFPKATLSSDQSNENLMSIIRHGQPVHKIETPAMQDIQPKADSLFNMQNFGQWDAPGQQQQPLPQGGGSWPRPPQEVNINEHPELIKAFNDLQRGAINRAKYEDFKMKYLASLEM